MMNKKTDGWFFLDFFKFISIKKTLIMGNVPLRVGERFSAVIGPPDSCPHQNAIMFLDEHVYHIYILNMYKICDEGWHITFYVKKIITGKFRKSRVVFEGKIQTGKNIILHA
jgi:hypothetical protein